MYVNCLNYYMASCYMIIWQCFIVSFYKYIITGYLKKWNVVTKWMWMLTMKNNKIWKSWNWFLYIKHSPCNLEKIIITTTKSRKQRAPSFRISIRESRMSSISGHRETPPPTLSRSMLCFVSRCLLIKVCLSLCTRPFKIKTLMYL